MRHKTAKVLLVVAAVLLLVGAGTIVMAQISAQFDLGWHVVGSGGGASSSAGYQVRGTIGQGLAAPPVSSSASFSVSSGYWAPGTESAPDIRIYIPIVVKG